MNPKIVDHIKVLDESDLDKIISFILGIVPVNQHSADRPDCPYCGGSHVIKYGHKDGKQRFFCKDCQQTFLHTTNTLVANSHFGLSIWSGFIQDTLCGKSLDSSATKYDFSHQTAFNMRHKVLMALQDLLQREPIVLSGTVSV